MKSVISTLAMSAALLVNQALAQEQSEREYEIPPTSSTIGDVPVISDEAMKECVKLYNETKWLGEELENTEVDRYSQASVDAYNSKAKKYNSMNETFNADCAGKQSYSA